jgi:hypothetical protein
MPKSKKINRKTAKKAAIEAAITENLCKQKQKMVFTIAPKSSFV